MTACPDFKHVLVLPHLKIQNANAISSPLTHGFPSMTAFLGLMWAMERKTRAAGLDLAFKAVGVICHAYQEQVTDDGFVHAFRLTRNPVLKDGRTAAIVEEGRIHLEISLVLAVHSPRWIREPETQGADVATVVTCLGGTRVAGGSVLALDRPQRLREHPWVVDLTGDDNDQAVAFAQLRRRLLPGFALVSRDDQLEARFSELQAADSAVTRLDAWLSLSRINWHYQPGQEGGKDSGKGAWESDRRGQGWIVPIPVGYGALGDLQAPGTVANARDAATPFRFVESLYAIGEWVSPHRLQTPQQLLWYADSRPDEGLYRCRNDYRAPADPFESLYDFD